MFEIVAALVVVPLSIVAGITAHEMTHYLVLWAGGHAPRFRWPSVEESRLLVAVEFDVTDGVSGTHRAAAVAPAVVGVVLGLVAMALFTEQLWTFASALSALWCAKLSGSDRALARGRVPA